MNLENLNVQELNANEMKTTDGGLLGIVAIALVGLVGLTSQYTRQAMAEVAAEGGTTVANIGGAK